MIGGSKGAELGLVLTNYYDEIHHLVLYAPSRYVFSGLDFGEDHGSSWTWKGEELAYIDILQSDFGEYIQFLYDKVVLNPVSYREMYETAIQNTDPDRKKKARIELSNVDGQVLLFAGGDDAMWPSDVFARKIGKVLGDLAEVVIYENAGHAFGAPPYVNGMALGGTVETNHKAKNKVIRNYFIFLRNTLLNNNNKGTVLLCFVPGHNDTLTIIMA